MDISVVIPLYNEDESIPELYAWIARVMKENHFSYEVIFINDGSTDRSWEIITELNKQEPEVVKGIKFRRNYGKSPALYCGFEQAQGDVVITMDADLQDSPDEIPELYRMIKEEGYDLVSGYKQKRYDPISKTLPTKLFNATARKISGIRNLHDFNCGLKAYRKAVVKNIEVYGEMHRPSGSSLRLARSRCTCLVSWAPSCSSSVLWQPSGLVLINSGAWQIISRSVWLLIRLISISR